MYMYTLTHTYTFETWCFCCLLKVMSFIRLAHFNRKSLQDTPNMPHAHISYFHASPYLPKYVNGKSLQDTPNVRHAHSSHANTPQYPFREIKLFAWHIGHLRETSDVRSDVIQIKSDSRRGDVPCQKSGENEENTDSQSVPVSDPCGLRRLRG